ncbi:MAG: hypothetical protein AAGC72_00110 [Planctomycetota bacterium]
MLFSIRTLSAVVLASFAPLAAAQSVFMILEQDADGDASHRALDRTPIGDGLDPVLQFIMLNKPLDEQAAQVLWETSETPIEWVRSADEQDYHFVEYAILPVDARIEYRIYEGQAENELVSLRHSRTSNDQDFGLDASIFEELSNGEYDIHAHLIVPDRPQQVMKQRVNVVEFAEVPLAEADEEEDFPTVRAGNGWVGATPTPGQIGNRHERALAHWNVVPEQTVGGGFTVGIVAHHLDGIDRVEIAANGGQWVKIHQPSINPRTQCEEYWTALDLNGQDVIELRAIAYPNQGKPYVVNVVGDEQTLTLYASDRGKVLELPAGRHELRPQDLPDSGWLTVRPAPGVDRGDCILIGRSRFWGPGNVRVQNMTIETPKGGGVFVGDPNNDEFKRVWFDACDFKGKPETWHLATMFDHTIYTDTTITDTQNVFTRSGQLLVRNVTVKRVYEDVIRTAGGLFVNLNVDRIDRGPFDGYHPDFLQSRYAGNSILQDVNVPNNSGQGIFPDTLEDAAFVRVNIKSASVGRAIQLMGQTKNVLFKGGSYDGSAALRSERGFRIPAGERIVFENVEVRENFRNNLLQTPRVEVRE